MKSVAVVGRDASLWLAAAALQRALGRTGLRVHAVELESRLAEVDAYAAVPTLGSLHRLLGLDERLFLIMPVMHAEELAMQERAIGRHGYDAYVDGQKAGIVTSGTQTPYLKKAIGMAYLPSERAAVGTEFDIDIRGRRAKAAVVPMPFYKRAR